MRSSQNNAEEFKKVVLPLVEKKELEIKLSEQEGVEITPRTPALFSFDPDASTLFLRHIPAGIKREELLAKLSPVAGFVALQMSRPLMSHNYDRLAWATFKSDHECE